MYVFIYLFTIPSGSLLTMLKKTISLDVMQWQYHEVETVHGGGASNIHTFLEFNWTDGKKYVRTGHNRWWHASRFLVGGPQI